jgi:hypothetical protein
LSNSQSELGSIDVPPQLSYDRALAFAYRWLGDADLCSDVRLRTIAQEKLFDKPEIRLRKSR